MRATAAQFVVIGHAFAFSNVGEPKDLMFSYIGYFASFGVVVFFALSGYLIAATADRHRSEGFRFFIVRRFARIFSAFVPALVFIALVDLAILAFHGQHINYRTITSHHFLTNLFMLQNEPVVGGVLGQLPFVSAQFGSGRQLWTLSFEWWLYVSFGLVFFLRRDVFRWVSLAVLCFALIVPLGNLQAASSYSGGLALVWVAGAGLWFLRDRIALVSTSVLVFFAAASSTIAAQDLYNAASNGNPFNIYNTGFMALSVTAIGCLISLSSRFDFSGRGERIVAYMSGQSYTLYLVHYTIMYAIFEMFTLSAVYFIPITIVLSNLFAAIIAPWTEGKHRLGADKLNRALAYRPKRLAPLVW